MVLPMKPPIHFNRPALLGLLKASNTGAEAILQTGIRVTVHEAMTEEYIGSVAEAIRKVASHYAV